MGFYGSAGVHVIVDVAGWFTGEPVAADVGRAPNSFPPPNSPVIMISDSAFAGIRWSGAIGYLQGAAWDARLESCRRLIGVSCRGREGYAPPTAVSELSTVPAGAYRTLIVATGYNDWSGAFPFGVDAMIAQARAKGIERVIWLTYREQVGYVSPGGVSNQASFAANNRFLQSVMASGRFPELILADWNGYSRWRPAWLTADGVHLTAAGSTAGCDVRLAETGLPRASTVPAGHRWTDDPGWLVRRPGRHRSSGLTAQPVANFVSSGVGFDDTNSMTTSLPS